MNASTEKTFDRIGTETITKAEAVKCPGPDFVDGLKMIRDKLSERIETAESEFGSGHEIGGEGG